MPRILTYLNRFIIFCKSSFNQMVTLQMCENRLFAWKSLFHVISQSVNFIVIYFALQELLEFSLQTETKMRKHWKQVEISAHEFWCLDSEFFDMIMISFSKWKYQSQNDHEKSLIPYKKMAPKPSRWRWICSSSLSRPF